jgi:hypothetical protein
MMTLLILFAALLAGGFFVEVFSAATAPLGYQDEKGFHFGPEQFTETNAGGMQNPS